MLKEFEEKFSAVNCEDLIGVNMWTEEGYKEFKKRKAESKLRCHDYIDFCSEMTYDLLKQ